MILVVISNYIHANCDRTPRNKCVLISFKQIQNCGDIASACE